MEAEEPTRFDEGVHLQSERQQDWRLDACRWAEIAEAPLMSERIAIMTTRIRKLTRNCSRRNMNPRSWSPSQRKALQPTGSPEVIISRTDRLVPASLLIRLRATAVMGSLSALPDTEKVGDSHWKLNAGTATTTSAGASFSHGKQPPVYRNAAVQTENTTTIREGATCLSDNLSVLGEQLERRRLAREKCQLLLGVDHDRAEQEMVMERYCRREDSSVADHQTLLTTSGVVGNPSTALIGTPETSTKDSDDEIAEESSAFVLRHRGDGNDSSLDSSSHRGNHGEPVIAFAQACLEESRKIPS